MPLHDAWAIDLDGPPGRTVADVQTLISRSSLSTAGPATRFLFALRWKLGSAFGWDRQPERPAESSYLHRLTPADRAASLVEPGTRHGSFDILYATRQESIAEIQNRTVHGFSVFALLERAGGYRLYWAIYVKPVGPMTAWYMRLINPFRRLFIYPALLRLIRSGWQKATRA